MAVYLRVVCVVASRKDQDDCGAFGRKRSDKKTTCICKVLAGRLSCASG